MSVSDDEINFVEFDPHQNVVSTAENNREIRPLESNVNIHFKFSPEAERFELVKEFPEIEKLNNENSNKPDIDTNKNSIDKFLSRKIHDKLLITDIKCSDAKTSEKVQIINTENAYQIVRKQKGREFLAELDVIKEIFQKNEFVRSASSIKFEVTTDEEDDPRTRIVSLDKIGLEEKAIAASRFNNSNDNWLIESEARDRQMSYEKATQEIREQTATEAKKLLQPLKSAVEAKVNDEKLKLNKTLNEAETKYEVEQQKTKDFIETSGVKHKSEIIQPLIDSSRIWIEQELAVERGDAESFNKLENLNLDKKLPRPNYVINKFKMMRKDVLANATSDIEISIATKPFNPKNSDQIIIAKIENKNRNLQVESVTKIDKDIAARKQNFIKETISETKLSSFFSSDVNSKKSDSLLNSYKMFRNDPSVQIVKIVSEFMKENSNNNKKQEFSDTVIFEPTNSQIGFEDKRDNISIPENEPIVEALDKAFEAETGLRELLVKDPDTNADLLFNNKSVSEQSNDLEKQNSTKKINFPDQNTINLNMLDFDSKTKSYNKQTDAIIAGCYAVRESKKVVLDISVNNDGLLEVKIDPTSLENASNLIKTAEILEADAQFLENDIFIFGFSLEDIGRINTYLDTESSLFNPWEQQTDFQAQLYNQEIAIGDQLSKEFDNQQTTMQTTQFIQNQNQDFQKMMDYQTTQENLNERLNILSQEAEEATIAGIPYGGIGQTFTYREDKTDHEIERENFWSKEREKLDEELRHEQNIVIKPKNPYIKLVDGDQLEDSNDAVLDIG